MLPLLLLLGVDGLGRGARVVEEVLEVGVAHGLADEDDEEDGEEDGGLSEKLGSAIEER